MKPIRAKEARELAHGIRPLVLRPDWRHAPRAGAYAELPSVKGLRASATRVLELLLRTVNEHHVVAHSTTWIAEQLGLGFSTVHRARNELVAAGLVQVLHHGLGRTVCVYRVAVEHIRGLLGRLPGSSHSAPGEHTSVVPGSGQTAPGEHTQRAGARDAHVPELTRTPLPPKSTDAPEPVDAGGSPPAPPQPSTSKCQQHGRRACRQCGLDRASLAKVARERAKRVEADRARERAQERRREDEEGRGEPEVVAARFDALRAELGLKRSLEHVNGTRS